MHCPECDPYIKKLNINEPGAEFDVEIESNELVVSGISGAGTIYRCTKCGKRWLIKEANLYGE